MSCALQFFQTRRVPLENTGDNTPAVIHTEVVPGDKLEIKLAAKGGGSEKTVVMLNPSDSIVVGGGDFTDHGRRLVPARYVGYWYRGYCRESGGAG